MDSETAKPYLRKPRPLSLNRPVRVWVRYGRLAFTWSLTGPTACEDLVYVTSSKLQEVCSGFRQMLADMTDTWHQGELSGREPACVLRPYQHLMAGLSVFHDRAAVAVGSTPRLFPYSRYGMVLGGVEIGTLRELRGSPLMRLLQEKVKRIFRGAVGYLDGWS